MGATAPPLRNPGQLQVARDDGLGKWGHCIKRTRPDPQEGATTALF